MRVCRWIVAWIHAYAEAEDCVAVDAELRVDGLHEAHHEHDDVLEVVEELVLEVRAMAGPRKAATASGSFGIEAKEIWTQHRAPRLRPCVEALHGDSNVWVRVVGDGVVCG